MRKLVFCDSVKKLFRHADGGNVFSKESTWVLSVHFGDGSGQLTVVKDDEEDFQKVIDRITGSGV